MKVWVILNDSCSEAGDIMFDKFLNDLGTDDYEFMIFDKEVLDKVKKQIECLGCKYVECN